MEKIPAADLPDWALSQGISSFTKEDVSQICKVPPNHVPQLMAPLRKRIKVFSPARGLWVPIPPEYRTWGAPDLMLYIEDMMAHLGANYLVDWLTAAERYGVSHHAPQVFQVATNRTLRNKQLGRSRLEFANRSYTGSVIPSPELKRKTGVNIAPVGTTMLMLASDPHMCGGMGNVANLVIELAEENKSFVKTLVRDANLFHNSALQRVGWLLDEFGEGAPEELSDLRPTSMSQISPLVPSKQKTGKLNTKWKIIVNEKVEPDL